MRGELLGLVKAMLTEDSMNRNVLQKQIDQAEYSMNYLMDEERLAQIEAEEADAEDEEEEEEESVSTWHFWQLLATNYAYVYSWTIYKKSL